MVPTRVLLLAALAAACHSYTPAPVDLVVHAREFAARLMTLDDARAADQDASAAAAKPTAFDPRDGLDRGEGRAVAVLFHPECRLARRRANSRRIERDHAGRWSDPELGADFARILEAVPHPWIAAASLGLSLPLDGRLGLERRVASATADEATASAWRVQHEVAHDLDAAWIRFSAAGERVPLLRRTCADLDRLASVARQLNERGLLTMAEARAFALEHRRREFDLASAEDRHAQADLQLKRALGLHPDAAVRCNATLELPLAIADRETRSTRLIDSPRLAPLRAAHRVTEHALELEVRRQWPDFAWRAGLGEEDAQPRATFGFTLPLPLFAGNDAAIARAAAARSEADEALRCGYEQLVQEHAIAEQALAAAERRRQFVVERLLPLADQQLAEATRLAELGQLEPLLILDAVVRAHTAHELAIDAAEAAALAAVAVNVLLASEPIANNAEETR